MIRDLTNDKLIVISVIRKLICGYNYNIYHVYCTSIYPLCYAVLMYGMRS